MKVNLLETTNNRQFNSERKAPVAFRGGASVATGAAGAAAETAAKKLPWLARALMYVGKNDGEILNTLVTAVGTAVIAPIFIAGNPISKEDKETKWYSAMRQPISAVIAMVMQISVNSAYNNYMRQMASLGKLGKHMDLRARPEVPYLAKIIKLENPDLSSKELAEAIEKRQKRAEKRQLQLLRHEMVGQNIEIKDLIDVDLLKETENQMKRELKEKYKEELKNKNPLAKSEFLKPHLTKEKIEARALEDLTKKIEFSAKVKHAIYSLRDNLSKSDKPTAEVLDEAIRIAQLNEKNLPDDVVARVVEKLEIAKAYEVGNGHRAFSSLPKLEGNNTLENVTHNVKVKRLLKVRTANAAKFFGKTKNIIGILVSLVTLPISCGLLNWAYPRVMEKVMPKLQPWIYRNDPDWDPKKAKVYGPPKEVKKVEIEKEDDDED